MADDVRLVDLDVVKRYSLAVRRESAPADEVLAALDASREYVLELIAAGHNGASPRRRRGSNSSSSTDDKVVAE